MGRPRRSAPRSYDGVAAPERRPSGAWRYRVWDASAQAYVTATFRAVAGPGGEDEHRREGGCAAGERWAKDTAAKVQLGMTSARRATLEDVGRDYVTQRDNANRAERYIDTIRRTLAWAKNVGVDDLNDKAIVPTLQRSLKNLQACRPGQLTPKPASARTKNQHIAILQAVGNYAVKMRILIHNPFLGLATYTEARRHRAVYTVAELRRIVGDEARDHAFNQRQEELAMIEQHRGDKPAAAEALGIHPTTLYKRLGSEPKADQWWMFMVLAAYTGLRSETLRALTWGMIDWDANRLRVPAEVTKADADVRVPLQPELAEILRDLKPGVGKATILPPDLAAVTSDQANVRTQAFLRRIGIVPGGRSVHAFRHTAVAMLTATGLSHFGVMDAVGHSSTQTSKHYARMADEYREQVRAEGWPEGEFFLRRAPPKVSQRTGSG